ncbi:hypothetical protein CN424_27035 [Bacillus cereus]|nr:hypothetical protein CN424_27035 [Bacillus cereus]
MVSFLYEFTLNYLNFINECSKIEVSPTKHEFRMLSNLLHKKVDVMGSGLWFINCKKHSTDSYISSVKHEHIHPNNLIYTTTPSLLWRFFIYLSNNRFNPRISMPEIGYD